MYDCVLILLARATYGNPGGWVVTFVRLERVHRVRFANSRGSREAGGGVSWVKLYR